jgi:hypothetical protein
MIGDVGGLHDALALIFAALISILNGSSDYIFAVTNLFTVNKNDY